MTADVIIETKDIPDDLIEYFEPVEAAKASVWKISTLPFKMAHFAIFPPALVKTPLLATCPEYVCRKCGKAREKIIEQGELMLGQHKRPNIRQKTDDPKLALLVSGCNTKGRNDKRAHYDYKTVGLTDCGCNAGFDGGIVLDPFMGAGTVALVAMQNARNFIGIELNQSYIDMAMERLKPYLLQTRLQVG